MDQLDAFVEELKRTEGREDVPGFPPENGRTRAKCLFLLTPPNKTVRASKLLTEKNPDSSARNLAWARRKAGLELEDIISWNIVPWYSEDVAREVATGLPWPIQLLGLLPRLRVVVLLGEVARKATPVLYSERPDLCVIHAPHPGAQAMNRPGKRAQLEAALSKAARELVDRRA
jgi:uracil-DNA glycosylase